MFKLHHHHRHHRHQQQQQQQQQQQREEETTRNTMNLHIFLGGVEHDLPHLLFLTTDKLGSDLPSAPRSLAHYNARIDGANSTVQQNLTAFQVSHEKKILVIYARWAPTSYKWGYKRYTWPDKWVIGAINPF